MQRSNSGDLVPLPPPGGNPFSGDGGPGPALPAARSVPTLPELLNALKRRWVLAVFLGLLLGTAAGAGVWLLLPSGKHTVRTLVSVKAPTKAIGRGPVEDIGAWKDNQIIFIKTRNILNQVLSKPGVAQLSMVAAAEDPIRLLEDLLVPQWKTSEYLQLTMTGDDPKQLEILLNAMTNVYVDEAITRENQQRNDQILRIKKLLESREKEVASRDSSIRQLHLVNAVNTTGGQASGAQQLLLTQQLSQHSGEIANLRGILEPRRLALKDLEEQLKKVDGTPVDPEMVNNAAQKDSRVRTQAEALVAIQQEYDRNVPLLQPGHNRVRQLTDELALRKSAFEQAVTRVRPEIEATVRSARRAELDAKAAEIKAELIHAERRLAYHEGAYDQLDKRIAAMNRAQDDVNRDLRDLAPKIEEVTQLRKELTQLEHEQTQGSRIEIMETAQTSLQENLKKKIVMATGVGAVGLAAMLLLVAYLEWRTRRIDSVTQVVNDLGMRVIGTIPAFPSKAALTSGDAAQDQSWRFVLNESVNSCRTMILHAAKTQSLQVLMVTSATQGEGKTSLASQLATSMAAAGLRTLLLDCDLRNPSLHKLFDSPVSPGCSEVLMQEVDASDAVQPTTVPNLWLIPAGQCSHRVVAALAQGHPLEALFNRLRGQFDFIVVDSCPVLPVADALLIGQHVDGVVISVMQDISQLPKVQTASEKLVLLNIPVLGAVVNGVKTDVYAYGYNYVKQLPA